MCLKHDKMFNFGLNGFVFVPFVGYIGLSSGLQWNCARVCVLEYVFLRVCVSLCAQERKQELME